MTSIGPDCVANRSWPLGEETPRLKDACLSGTDVEDAIRLLVEIRYLAWHAGQRCCVGGRQLATILDIEADRSKFVAVHAAVHGKPQRLALGFEILCERCKGPIGPAIVFAPIGAECSLVRSKLQTTYDSPSKGWARHGSARAG
jgi:hypothetical protein